MRKFLNYEIGVIWEDALIKNLLLPRVVSACQFFETVKHLLWRAVQIRVYDVFHLTQIC